MKSTKIMLSGVMLMLLAIFASIIEMGRNSWLAGASLILVIVAVLVFIVGIVMQK